MADNNIQTQRDENIVNREPIFSGRFHTNVMAVTFKKPCTELAQLSGVSGKTFTLIGCNALIVGSGDTSYKKIAVNVNTAAYGVHDFELCQK